MSTLYTSTEGDVTDAGVDVAGDAADAASMTAQWAAGCGAFAINYARVLGKIFNTEGGGELVARLMQASLLRTMMSSSCVLRQWWLSFMLSRLVAAQ